MNSIRLLLYVATLLVPLCGPAWAVPFRILQPTTALPASGGRLTPQKFYVSVTKPAGNLRAVDFTAQIGTAGAAVVAAYETDDRYVLVVLPLVPVDSAEPADLTVTVAGESASVPQAVRADTRPPKAIVFVIDRSTSFWSGIDFAAHAANQTLSRLSPGDKIAVVAFDSKIQVYQSLVEVTPPTGGAPVFADAMEAGGANWRRLESIPNVPPSDGLEAFWRLVSRPDAQSPVHYWSLMPDGPAPWKDLRLASKSLDLSGSAAPWLGFWFRLDKITTNTATGYLKRWMVELSDDNGATWEPHKDYYGTLDILHGAGHKAARYSWTTYKPSRHLWRYALFDLKEYAGKQNVQVSMTTWQGGALQTGNDLKIDDVVVFDSPELNGIDRVRQAIYRVEAAPLGGSEVIGAIIAGAGIAKGAGGDTEKYVMLLSDGKQFDDRGERPIEFSEVSAALAPDVKLVGAGFGSGPGLDALQATSTRSGGPFRATAAAESLPAVFGSLMSPLMGEESLLEIEQDVVEGSPAAHDFFITPGTSGVSVRVYADEGSGVSLTLRDPQGTTIDIAYAGSHPQKVTFSGTGSSSSYELKSPDPGLWQAALSVAVVGAPAGRVPRDGTLLTRHCFLTAAARTNLSASIQTAKPQFRWGESMKFAVILTDNQPIRDATVTGTASWTSAPGTVPPTVVQTLAFSDEDRDGVYTATLPGTLARPGTYFLDATATGNGNGTPAVPFTRKLQGVALVEMPLCQITSSTLSANARTVVLTWNIPLTGTSIEQSRDLMVWSRLASNLSGTTYTHNYTSPVISASFPRVFYRVKGTLPDPPPE